MKRIKFKLKNDNTVYTYIGDLYSFKMTTGYHKIVNIENAYGSDNWNYELKDEIYLPK